MRLLTIPLAAGCAAAALLTASPATAAPDQATAASTLVRVSLAVADKTVPAHSAVVVSGRVRGADGRPRVKIQERRGGRWVVVAKSATSKQGSYRTTDTVSVGRETIRAVAKVDGAMAVSDKITVKGSRDVGPRGLDGCEDQLGGFGVPRVTGDRSQPPAYLCRVTDSTEGAAPDATIVRDGQKMPLSEAFPNGRFDHTIGYALQYDTAEQSPYWVATYIYGDYQTIPCYKPTSAPSAQRSGLDDPEARVEAAAGGCRADNFLEDPTGIGPEPWDYTGSTLNPPTCTPAGSKDCNRGPYDRGHQSPAGIYQMTATTNQNSFYMSNMSPQTPGLNQGVWRLVEAYVKDWSMKYGELYVVTGPVGQDLTDRAKNAYGWLPQWWPLSSTAKCDPTSGGDDCFQYYRIGSKNQISAGRSYYKLVYAPIQNKAIAFIVDNDAATARPSDQPQKDQDRKSDPTQDCNSIQSQPTDPYCAKLIEDSIRTVAEVERATGIEFLYQNVDPAIKTQRSQLSDW